MNQGSDDRSVGGVTPNAQQLLDDRRVAIWQGSANYAADPPYHPSEQYPELSFSEVSGHSNPAYVGVRRSLQLLGLDAQNAGTPMWNPLSEFIRRGEHVVIKPNFVLSRHYDGGDFDAVITHPSVLRAVVDYVFLAVGNAGKITIADAPQMDCNFDELLLKTGLPRVQQFYRERFGFAIQIVDLRPVWYDHSMGEKGALMENRHSLPGDPAGSAQVDLGARSAFSDVSNCEQFYGADFNRNETIALHTGNVHRYSISRTVLEADVVVLVPKLKVHKKVGVTLNAKGLVGITTNKNCLVHYRLGTPEVGGDQFPGQLLSVRERAISGSIRKAQDLLLARRAPWADRTYWALRAAYRAVVKPLIGSVNQDKVIFDGGNWHGNDSAWRMVVDLMRILYFASADGVLHEQPQRRLFSVVDGIVGGELNGPLSPRSKQAGIVAAGFNPLSVDATCTRLMGFDGRQLKWMQRLLSEGFSVAPEKLELRSDDARYRRMFQSSDPLLAFEPHPGWKGKIEADRRETVAY